MEKKHAHKQIHSPSWSTRRAVQRRCGHGIQCARSRAPLTHLLADWQSANILIDENFRAKVSDFGLSQKKQIGYARLTLYTGQVPMSAGRTHEYARALASTSHRR